MMNQMSEHTKEPWKLQEGFNTIYALTNGDVGACKPVAACKLEGWPGMEVFGSQEEVDAYGVSAPGYS